LACSRSIISSTCRGIMRSRKKSERGCSGGRQGRQSRAEGLSGKTAANAVLSATTCRGALACGFPRYVKIRAPGPAPCSAVSPNNTERRGRVDQRNREGRLGARCSGRPSPMSRRIASWSPPAPAATAKLRCLGRGTQRGGFRSE
jgi:hypothetical protein